MRMILDRPWLWSCLPASWLTDLILRRLQPRQAVLQACAVVALQQQTGKVQDQGEGQIHQNPSGWQPENGETATRQQDPMHEFGPAGFQLQSPQIPRIPANQAGFAHPTREDTAGIGDPALPYPNPRRSEPCSGTPSSVIPARMARLQPGRRQPVRQQPHQQRCDQPEAHGTQQGPHHRTVHQRVRKRRPFQDTAPLSRLRIASTKTPRKNSTGIGNSRLIQLNRPTRRLSNNSCTAKAP